MSRRTVSEIARDRDLEETLRNAVTTAVKAYNDGCNAVGTPVKERRTTLTSVLCGCGVIYYRLCGGTRARFVKMMDKTFDHAAEEIGKAQAVVHREAGHA